MENSVYCPYCNAVVGRITVAMIPSLPLNIFRKSVTCPSSQMLLDFIKSTCGPVHRGLVAEHLQECEFCRAEIQLLERFPLQQEHVRFTQIPPELRALAESVLGKPTAGQSFGFAEAGPALN